MLTSVRDLSSAGLSCLPLDDVPNRKFSTRAPSRGKAKIWTTAKMKKAIPGRVDGFSGAALTRFVGMFFLSHLAIKIVKYVLPTWSAGSDGLCGLGYSLIHGWKENAENGNRTSTALCCDLSDDGQK